MICEGETDFIGVLKNYGLQVTCQRLAVYQALHSDKSHPSAEAIYEKVKKRFPMISLGTVYKTLEKLCEVGLIQKVSPVTEVARYDAKTDTKHYLICSGCQAIQGADHLITEQKSILPDKNGFQVVGQRVVLHGYCRACKESDNQPAQSVRSIIVVYDRLSGTCKVSPVQ